VAAGGQGAASRAIANQVFTWIRGDFTAASPWRVDPWPRDDPGRHRDRSLIHIYSTAYMHEESDASSRATSRISTSSRRSCWARARLELSRDVRRLGRRRLCSYLLIGRFQKKSASECREEAFIVNRIGDFGFVLGVLLAFVPLRSVDFQDIARAAAR